jgi:hypothetical protein
MVSYYRTMNSKTNASLGVVAIAAVVLLFGSSSIPGHQALAYYYHYHYGHYGHYGHYHYYHYGHYHYHYHYHY